MSYNVLESIAANNMNFPKVPGKFLNFDSRFKRIINEIEVSDADIICLQVFFK